MAHLVQPQPLHSTSCVHLRPFLHNATEYSDHQPITGKVCSLTTPLKCSFMPLVVLRTVSRLHPSRAVVYEACEFSDVHSELDSYQNSYDNEARGEVEEAACHNFKPAVTCSTEEFKETLRRQRIGLANKGKVPWNKGRKHSPETCARIRERTLEALRDPKVKWS